MADLYKMTLYVCDKVGKRVDWGDDIDLNRLDCSTQEWEKYFDAEKGEDG